MEIFFHNVVLEIPNSLAVWLLFPLFFSRKIRITSFSISSKVPGAIHIVSDSGGHSAGGKDVDSIQSRMDIF